MIVALKKTRKAAGETRYGAEFEKSLLEGRAEIEAALASGKARVLTSEAELYKELYDV